MRRITFVLTLVLAVLISMNSNAQRTCAAHDVMLEQLAEDPQMQENLDELEEYTQKFSRDFGLKAGETRNIPVNVIVVYSNSLENISDAQIQSQIDVLNIDYGGTNQDINTVPSEFSAVTANGTGISFTISNIERHYDRTTSWGTRDRVKKKYPPTSPETTLNMWVCNIGGGILGYAQFPGGAAATDGVVFSPQFCGSSDYDDGSFYLQAPFDKGRTAVHEVGHYLNLRHIWGDGPCGYIDYVDDTPDADGPNYYCPSHPHESCGSNDMFMNYMDYVDDACMVMFSEGQSARMWACLNSTRANLGSGSVGNVSPTAEANGPYTATLGDAVSFSSAGSADSDGSIASYYWDFGNGASSTAANPSYTYATAGSYTATLTVTDNEGATGTDQASVNITDGGGGGEDLPMVSDISMTTKQAGRNFSATAGITITSGGSAVASAQVDVTWGGSVSGSATGLTDAAGYISFKSPRSNDRTFTITIDNVAKIGYYWDIANSVDFASVTARTAYIAEAEYSVYPNPADNEITITTNSEDVSVGYIYSYTGQLVKSYELNEYENTISLEDFTPGMYIIKVNNNDEVYTQKFIKR